MEKQIVVYIEKDPIQGIIFTGVDVYVSKKETWDAIHNEEANVISMINSSKSEFPNGVIRNTIVEDAKGLIITDANGFEFRWVIESINI